MDRKAYLDSLVPSREMIDRFVRPAVNGSAAESDFRAFDADLGWVHTSGVRENSIEGSKGFYNYESDGARRVVNFSDRPCRIHSYGDSFTHGHQVSDGETWQEYLAAHIQEPIRNYGVGGCSVYQAYRRMCRVEMDSGAEYIILNIFDDDHFRNLDAWQSIRMDIVPRFTLPHLKVDLGKGTCEEVENPSGTPEAVYDLCDSEFVWEAYQDDPVLKLVVAQVEALRPGEGRPGEEEVDLDTFPGPVPNLRRRMQASESSTKADQKSFHEVATAAAAGLGMSLDQGSDGDLYAQIVDLHTEAALFATRYVVERVEALTQETGKKLLLMLSFCRGNVAAELAGKPRFDRSFREWLENRDFPVIDMREAFVREYSQFNTDIDTYLDRYYIGHQHHTPAGNFFTTWAIKDRACRWLDPEPLPYR